MGEEAGEGCGGGGGWFVEGVEGLGEGAGALPARTTLRCGTMQRRRRERTTNLCIFGNL